MGKGVLLGMSGGTDSSVAALLLQEQGYEVTGITFRFHEDEGDTAYLDDAREVAAQLGIRHLTYDAREVFRQTVEDYFVREYLAGRTPVPCTLCNNLLKWPLLCRVADREGIPHVATGHYVRTVTDGGLHYIVRGADPDKDQSFFLWGLPQEVIRRMVLPMGGRTKAEVRRLAAERGLRKAAVKRDSLGVCFCPGDYRPYLRARVADGSIRPGWFYHKNEDDKVKSLKKLFQIYLSAVGGNAALLLNIPPDTTGRIAAPDALALDALGRMLKREFPRNLLENVHVRATSELDDEHAPSAVLEESSAYWQAAADDARPELIFDFGTQTAFDSLMLQENIATGQQIEAFDIYIDRKNRWKKIGKYTVIGYKRICRFKKTYRAKRIRVVIRACRGKATLLRVQAFKRETV